MVLSPEEITALENLSRLSNQLWFQIKSPTYIWDNDNKIRLSVMFGCRVFLQCSESFVCKLSNKEKRTINMLNRKIQER